MTKGIKRLFMKYVALTVSLSLISLTLSVSASENSETDAYDSLRLRWDKMLVGGDTYDTADPDIAVKIESINTVAQGYLNNLNRNPAIPYLWSDRASTTDSQHITNNYARIKDMAFAYRTRGAELYQNEELKEAILYSLDWMDKNRYMVNAERKYNNWWDWEIGVPQQLVKALVMMYDDLTQAELERYCNALRYFCPTPFGDTYEYVGANRLWRVYCVLGIGVLLKESDTIALARDGMSKVFEYVKVGDGFYEDGSFIQHTWYPYTGGYGRSLLVNIVEVLNVIAGSDWDVVDPNGKNVYGWVTDAIEPVIYKGLTMDMIRGREMSRRYSTDKSTTYAITGALVRMTQFAPQEMAERIRSIVKTYLLAHPVDEFCAPNTIDVVDEAKRILYDESVIPAQEYARHNRFASMDRVVHRSDDFTFGLSMYSDRTGNYEFWTSPGTGVDGPSENLKGWYTAEGMTYLYNDDLSQYNDGFWPTVNPYRLSGTTVDTIERETTRGISGRRSSRTFVGGSDIDAYGVTGMDLKGQDVSLTAKKSWFMFDDEVVALGAGINSTDSRSIETTIENRKLTGDGTQAITVDGAVKPISFDYEEKVTGASWAHLDGTGGYYFPGEQDVNFLREQRTGKYHDINTHAGSQEEFTRSYATMWFDHGINPTNKKYAYVLMPGKTAQETAAYAQNADIEILENTSEAQAVKEKNLGIIGINFWQNQTKTVGKVTADTQASVMIKETEDYVEVAVSDPTQKNFGNIRLTLDIPVAGVYSADSNFTVTRIEPRTELVVRVANSAGKTYRIKFYKNSDGAPQYNDFTEVDTEIEGESASFKAYKTENRISVPAISFLTAIGANVAETSDGLDATFGSISLSFDFEASVAVVNGHDVYYSPKSMLIDNAYTIPIAIADLLFTEYDENINLLSVSKSPPMDGIPLPNIAKPSGLGIMIDDLNDFSQIFQKTDYLKFHTHNPERFGCDKSRLVKSTPGSQRIIYALPGDIREFKMYAYFDYGEPQRLDENFIFAVSKDNTTYTNISFKRADAGQASHLGSWIQYIYTNETAIPKDIRYLAISFVNTSGTLAWNPAIGRVEIRYLPEKNTVSSEASSTPKDENDRDYILYDDFNQNNIGDAPNGWTINAGNGTSAIVDEISLSLGKCVVLDDKSTTEKVVMRRSFTRQQGIFSASFDFMEPVVGISSKFYLMNQNTMAVALFTKGNYLVFRDISGRENAIASIIPGSWYTVSLENINTLRQSFDIYVNGKLAFAGATFRNPVYSIDNFYFESSPGVTGAVYLNNVSVYK